MIDQANRRIGVYGLARSGGAVLLTRVAAGYPQAGHWTLPGGASEWGEPPEQALAREVAEETGLTVTDATPHSVDSVVRPSARHGSLHLVGLVYEISVVGNIRAEIGGSTDAAEWFDRTDLPALGSLAERVLQS